MRSAGECPASLGHRRDRLRWIARDAVAYMLAALEVAACRDAAEAVRPEVDVAATHAEGLVRE